MSQATPSLTDGQFSRLARVIHAETGIAIAQTKRNVLSLRLYRRLQALNLSDYTAYCDLLEHPDGADEKKHVIVAITTNVTAFFREPHHFDLLAKQILPPLVARAKAGGRVRLWSAACSSGEEAYSMAMTVLDVFPDAARFDLRILATDIDRDVIARSRHGEYDEAALRDVIGTPREKYIARAGDRYTIRPEVRDLLRFAELNLNGHWPFKGGFDAIFCRNVVIYFEPIMRQALWDRFASRLGAGGYLLIGHSERVDGPAASKFRSVGITAYQHTAPQS
jgi:chemotaxis protein methyltransferase CheR